MKKKTEEKRQAIIEVATQTFGELGFDGTSMSEIRERLGGSKATLYNYFSSKEELFFEVIFTTAEGEFEAVLAALKHDENDISASLTSFGEKFLSFIYSPQIQAHRRLAIAQSGRTELGKQLYERGILRNYEIISDFLKKAMDTGNLKQADKTIATHHLCALLESEFFNKILLQVQGELSEEEIKAATKRAIDVFMAAYGKN